MTTPEITTEFDPYQSASNPVEKTYDLFGKIDLHAYACGLKKDLPPYDPQIHDRRYTAVKIYIQPLEEIEVKYPRTLESTWVAEFATWAKITWASIRACGFENLREINGKWARIARVDSLEKPFERTDMNGNPTGEMSVKKTFKFVEFFADEDECRAMYLANGGQPFNGHNVATSAPVTTPEEQEKATAREFLRVSIVNIVKAGKTNVDEIKTELVGVVAHPMISKFYTVDSPEVLDLINQTIQPFNLSFKP